MKNILILLVLVASLSLSAFASKDLVTAVKPYAKHPAVVTRSYHGLQTVGHYTGVNYLGKKVGSVTKKILF